jgi:hypothetical protein
MHTIKSVGVLSVAKILGAIHAVFGLVCMPFFLLIGLIGSMVPNQHGRNPFGAIGGIVMDLFLPVFYGVFGFIFGALGAFLYNFMAKWLGGMEIQIQPVGNQLSIG